MSSSDAVCRRSGDPRNRGATGSPSPPSNRRRRAVALSFAAAVVLVSLATVAARPDPAGTTPAADLTGETLVETQAGVHAAAACDLTRKAELAAEATVVDERARYAAAVLLLDRAVIESARAAGADTRLGELDTALEAAHAAGHAGDHDEWQAALRTANAQCRAVLEGG